MTHLCLRINESLETSKENDKASKSKHITLTLRQHNLQGVECKPSCSNSTDCKAVRDMLEFSCLIEDYLREESKVFKPLKPRFVLIGSVKEQTRVGQADEIDVTIDFENLEGWLTVDETDPSRVIENQDFRCPDDVKAVLPRFYRKGTKEFDFFSFLEVLLEEIGKGISTKKPPKSSVSIVCWRGERNPGRSMDQRGRRRPFSTQRHRGGEVGVRGLGGGVTDRYVGGRVFWGCCF